MRSRRKSQASAQRRFTEPNGFVHSEEPKHCRHSARSGLSWPYRRDLRRVDAGPGSAAVSGCARDPADADLYRRRLDAREPSRATSPRARQASATASEERTRGDRLTERNARLPRRRAAAGAVKDARPELFVDVGPNEFDDASTAFPSEGIRDDPQESADQVVGYVRGNPDFCHWRSPTGASGRARKMRRSSRPPGRSRRAGVVSRGPTRQSAE